MADLVVRGLDQDTKDRLRARAASNHRSMNAELRELLRTALSQPAQASHAELKKLAADIRALSAGTVQTPSEDLLRESRDQR